MNRIIYWILVLTIFLVFHGHIPFWSGFAIGISVYGLSDSILEYLGKACKGEVRLKSKA